MKRILFLLCSLFCLHLSLKAQGPVSRVESKIDQVHELYSLSGEGVVTVIMDRGIDYRHPDFIDENGNTRIAYIYDLYDETGANDPDNPIGSGTVYTEEEINNALQAGGEPLITDIFGHGTATSGIVAGNGTGIADETIFRGVAYNAKIISIIVTKDYVPPLNGNPGQPGQFSPAVLPKAFDFATQKIDELGIPSVTILNIGSISDPTDGSVGFCELVDAYVAAGNPFVCGVGDDGGNSNSAIKTLQEGSITEFQISKGESGFLRFLGWYSEDDRVELTIERPDGSTEGPFAPPQNETDAADTFLDGINIYHRGKDVEFSNSSSNLRMLMIDFSGALGTYKVQLNGLEINSNGTINGMLNPSRLNNLNFFENNDTPGGSINSYSACLNTISPGDYVSTNNWTDVNGIPRQINGQGMPGELWLGSSEGPTMDGRYGIDLVAPGELAVGAYSFDSYYGNFEFNTLEGSEGYYGIQNAVSGAAPIVTGVMALMLEADPNLTPQEIKEILQNTSREDSFTGSTPNNSFGYGKLDAKAAVEEVLMIESTEDIGFDQKGIIFPNPFEDYIQIGAELEDEAALFQMSIFNSLGSKVVSMEVQNYSKIDVSFLAKGPYFILLESDQTRYVQKVWNL